MTAKDFIEKKLHELKATTKMDVVFNSDKELADFILKTIMSKKFRKFSVDSEHIEKVKWAINNSIENNLPIKFVFPFGGYKLWRLDETPEADWAELFVMMYYSKWLKPIAEVYAPGIWFDFCSDDVIVERMNNIPKNDTEKYASSFNTIIDFLKIYLPENIKFTLTPVSSFYTPEEFEVDLNERISEMEKSLGGLPVLEEKHKKMVDLNVKLKDGQDSDPLWREKVELVHQAYYAVSKRRPYSRAKDKILTFCTKMPGCISVGTTKSSVAKFWVGVGALKKDKDEYLELVLSPSQLEVIKPTQESILFEGLNGKNFRQIKII